MTASDGAIVLTQHACIMPQSSRWRSSSQASAFTCSPQTSNTYYGGRSAESFQLSSSIYDQLAEP
eukprot:2234957-Pleurochrysis_carterae.AAC.2